MTQNLENKTQMNLPGMENLTDTNQDYSKPRMSELKVGLITVGLTAGAAAVGYLSYQIYQIQEAVNRFSLNIHF